MKGVSTYLPAFIMLVCSIIVIQFPLLNYLGYEFSAATSLLLSLVLGPVTIQIFRRSIRAETESPLSAFEVAVKQSYRKAGILLAIPFIIASLNIFLVKNCSYGEGLVFYLLIPVVTGFWSLSLAILCGVLFRRATLFYFVFLIVDLLHPLYLGYFTPAIYSYNFIYGYFPGFSYDEVLTISMTLVLFRSVTVLCALLFLLSSRLFLSNTQLNSSFKEKITSAITSFRLDGKYFTSVFLLVVLCLTWLFRDELEFQSSAQSIQRALSATKRTEHFNIMFAPGSFRPDEIEFIAKEHEFRLYQVQTALNVKFKDFITSYIYPDAEIKRTFIGTGTTNIAKPWHKELHLNKDSWQEVLKHELVHIVAGEFGLPVIKAHYNTGLTEGLATAIDNDWGNRTLHQYAAAMKKFKIAPNPEQLISPRGFLVQSSSVSYVLMGSFCKYLIDLYGIEKFKTIYSGVAPEEVYGKPYPLLLEEWQQELQSIVIPDSWKHHIEYFFRRPSIFAKECARTIARLNETGFRYLSNKQPAQAKTVFEVSLAQSWNTSAFTGLISSEYAQTEYDNVIRRMKKQLEDTSRQSSMTGLMLTYGHALWANGDTAKSKAVFNALLEYDVSDRTNETALARIEALNDTILANRLRPLFTSNLAIPDAIALINSTMLKSANPMLPYLKAKLLFASHRYNDAIALLSPAAYYLSSKIEFAKYKLLGESYFRLATYQRAEEYFIHALQFTDNQSSRIRIEDWIQRCEWFGRHRGEMLE